jgi:hypothetical protein
LKPFLPILLLAAVAARAAPVGASDSPTTGGRTRGAVQTKFRQPTYPENLVKTEAQGNAFFVGRIDREGRVRDLHIAATSNPEFVRPSVEAIESWRFEPAERDGRPIEIFANVGIRFRLQTAHRGEIPQPILGDLSVSPADARGRSTAPDGFPIRRGRDAGLRAEAQVDVPPQPELRTATVKIEAISPGGKRIPIFQPPVAVAAGATEVKISVMTPVSEDWEEGVWMLVFLFDGVHAGSGQFWLASEPAMFHFVIPDHPRP